MGGVTIHHMRCDNFARIGEPCAAAVPAGGGEGRHDLASSSLMLRAVAAGCGA